MREFSGAQVGVNNNVPHEVETILDSGSTILLGKRQKDVKNLTKLKKKVIMANDSGDKPILEEEERGNWGQAYLDKSAIASIISLSDEVSKRFRVCINTDFENCSYVTHK